MNGKKSRAFRRKDENRAKPEDLVIIARAYKAAIERSKIKPKPLVTRTRITAPLHSPTWPGSENQFNQGRPVIVMRPVRAFAKALMDTVMPGPDGTKKVPDYFVDRIRGAMRLPKWRIDALAMRT
jgi:hypothetical protein